MRTTLSLTIAVLLTATAAPLFAALPLFKPEFNVSLFELLTAPLFAFVDVAFELFATLLILLRAIFELYFAILVWYGVV